MARPLRQLIGHIHHPRPIENMTRGFETRWHLRRAPKIKQGGKRQPHLTPFIRNQRPTPSTTDLAGENALMLPPLTVVEAELSDAVRDAHVAFVKNGGPLHWRAVQRLADYAVTDFRVNRVRAHFVLDGLTVAPGTVFCRKGRILNRRKCVSKFFLHKDAALLLRKGEVQGGLGQAHE